MIGNDKKNRKTRVNIGIDIGSVYVKTVAISLCPPSIPPIKPPQVPNSELRITKIFENTIIFFKPIKVGGSQFEAVKLALKTIFEHFNSEEFEFTLGLSGTGANFIANQLKAPAINEFKAIAYGTHLLYPDINTILEIGGDRSKFLIINGNIPANLPRCQILDLPNSISENDLLYSNKQANMNLDDLTVSISDYERNGECAAGTGSFIDQQAVRMNYEVEELGDLIQKSNKSANIAGRCSVFAKSDMIHAQQRGFSPEAIMKGLCEAVVRNFKGTVLRGKSLIPKVAFIGGVAQNASIAQIMKEMLEIEDDDFIVPTIGMHIGALGSAILSRDTIFDSKIIGTLADEKKFERDSHKHTDILEMSNVRITPIEQMTSPITNFSENKPIDCYLGIDIGSVSSNFVLLDINGLVIDEIYTRTESRPVEVTIRSLQEWQVKWGSKINIIGVGSTGSGRELVGELVGADSVHDEITAHKNGANFVSKKLFFQNK